MYDDSARLIEAKLDWGVGCGEMLLPDQVLQKGTGQNPTGNACREV